MLTVLDGVSSAVLQPVATHPVEICDPVHALVIQPGDAQALGVPSERFSENQIRPASRLVRALLALDQAPLSVPREPHKRVIGTCRHFAVIRCGLLRYRGIPARVRCGFATYFQPGQGLDHWITEYWDDLSGRWVRIDSEILGQEVLSHPEDLRTGEFLTAGEAWRGWEREEKFEERPLRGAKSNRGATIRMPGAIATNGTRHVATLLGAVLSFTQPSPGHLCAAT